MPAATFPESTVVDIWRQHLIGRTDLETEDGKPIRIIYPGMVSNDRGADFVDAVIHFGGKQQRGNVEIHVNSSGWWEHGHHIDPAYNGIMLHVVYRQDREKLIRLQNGNVIPTLVLEGYLAGRIDRRVRCSRHDMIRTLPCKNIAHQQSSSILSDILNISGEARFFTKVAFFRDEISRNGSEQALYTGIMESLGYTKNKRPMGNLARLLPLARLHEVFGDHKNRINYLDCIQALLLGTAGFLPSQKSGETMTLKPPNIHLNKLEILWDSLEETPKMDVNDWQFYMVRPANHPTRRLIAMSWLLHRYRENGLLAGLLNSLCSDYRSIEKSLYVPAAGFGEPSALLGRSRAADIILNILLPLAFARAELDSNSESGRQILDIYRQYPRLAAHSVEKHMCRQFGIDRGRVNSARQQQGLIHIYRTLCSRGECGICPLNTCHDELL